MYFASKDIFTQKLEEEFSQYFSGENDFALCDFSNIYFEGYEFNLFDLTSYSGSVLGVIINSKSLYVAVSNQNSMFEFSLIIYKFNLDESEKEILFTKSGYKTGPKVYSIDDTFYIEYYMNIAYADDSRYIDRYSILEKNMKM